MLEPFLMIVQHRQHSFSCLSFIELFDRNESQLFMRVHSTTKLSEFVIDYLVRLTDGLSLGLEHSNTPL